MCSMLPYLVKNAPFPAISEALDEPNGLLAAGADLSVSRLLDAYSNGIFPWYSADDPILWWSPDPRTVFVINEFKTHKSVIKTLKNNQLKISLNKDFEQVIQQCSLPRNDDPGTWINEEMFEAYSALHQQGHAHSVEVWQNEKLVGGIYGVAVNKIFCGESMFSSISNGSKIALSCLISYLKKQAYTLLDCQIENPHLMSLGAANISREDYLEILKQNCSTNNESSIWQKKSLDWQSLLLTEKEI